MMQSRVGVSSVLKRALPALPYRAPRARVGFQSTRAFAFQNEIPLTYAKGSNERAEITKELQRVKEDLPTRIPISCGGKIINDTLSEVQYNPSRHAEPVAQFASATRENVEQCIDAALAAGRTWGAKSFEERAAIFEKAADLVATKYRWQIVALTILGQGKNVWQAEIDAAAEICDFFRAYISEGRKLEASHTLVQTPGTKNEIHSRPLGGFVYAVSPFNFTALGATLVGAPLIMGNPVVWKPSPNAVQASWLLYQILLEAGLPEDVVQFVPGDAVSITETVLNRPEFAGLSFIGSTAVLKELMGKIGVNTAAGIYKNYPRVVGETGGKDFHLIHASADVDNAAMHTIRAAFEMAGQKCSACSRVYVAESVWPQFRKKLVAETEKLIVGDAEKFGSFVTPVIHEQAFKSFEKLFEQAKGDPNLEVIAGGSADGSVGYFVQPTIVQTKDPNHEFMRKELFGPLLTVYVYRDHAWEETLSLVDNTSTYGLTGAVFAKDATALKTAEDALAFSAGNFYVNGKCTGAVVMQQPFGGGRDSGTNDKTGTMGLLSRWVSFRTISRSTEVITKIAHPSNEV